MTFVSGCDSLSQGGCDNRVRVESIDPPPGHAMQDDCLIWSGCAHVHTTVAVEHLAPVEISEGDVTRSVRGCAPRES